MAINPRTATHQELNEIDLFNIDFWELHFDRMLTDIRNWKNENELYEKLGAKFIPDESKTNNSEIDDNEPFIHTVALNQLLVELSGVKEKYKNNDESKIFIAIYKMLELTNGCLYPLPKL